MLKIAAFSFWKRMERLYRYLFLDIDGVLNTGRHSNYLVDNGLSETDADGYLFDPKAVENLEYIIEETDAKIIITSTWRLDGDMQALWRNRDLALLVSLQNLTVEYLEAQNSLV